MSENSIKKELGRPLTFSRDKIVERVMQLFWTHGYNNLSLNSISKEVGLNRSSFYNAFKSKDALFIECLNHYLANSPTVHLATFNAGDNVGALMKKVLSGICEQRSLDSGKRGCFATNAFSEISLNDSQLSQLIVEKNKIRKKQMQHIMQCAIEQGELDESDDPEIISNLMLSFMVGLNMHAKKNNSFDELVAMCHVFLEKIGFKDNQPKH